jgi:Tfp pilus assembly protein PilE
MNRRRRSCGFSLAEVATVLFVIMLLAAIAVPKMFSAHMKANEASAVASLKAIHAAETLYATLYPAVGYAGNLVDLGSHGSTCEQTSKTNACLIMDPLLTSGLKSGYMFDLVGDGQVPDRNYIVTAAPVSPGHSGRCTLVSDQSGEIRIANLGDGSRFSEGQHIDCVSF